METDLLIIGAGINGVGIARDAAGRGLQVAVCDQGDLGGATSSASTKLIHGGLRYLEQFEFRLVREALMEREVLLRNAPHLIRPLRFIMPHSDELRPGWMIRFGLFIYDHLGGRRALPASESLTLNGTGWGAGLKPDFRRGFSYYDCWADDARLVVANARSAADLGATILPRTRFEAARPADGCWRAELTELPGGRKMTIRARGLVNASGPWVNTVLERIRPSRQKMHIRLVKGSHFAVPKVYDGDHAFILQNDDRRVIFIIPYGGRYSIIGTTDVAVEDEPENQAISAEEIDYLRRAVNRYLATPVTREQITWSYAGVRPLYDDGETNPSKVSRDYELEVQEPEAGCVLLNIFGGKLTTFRKLSEHAMDKFQKYFPSMRPAWTERAPLPGGDLSGSRFEAFVLGLCGEFEFVPEAHLEDLARRHGANCRIILKGATTLEDLGEHFGNGLYAREVDYLCQKEWARTAEDILWRRTKCGLELPADCARRLETYLADRAPLRSAVR